MKKRQIDDRQLTLDSLFEMPKTPTAKPGSLDNNMELRHLLSEALKKTTKSRYEVAAKMSELLGHEVTKNQLDAWTAESREGWRFPFECAAAFEVACETLCLTEFLANKRGCKVYVGEDIYKAELGKLEAMKDEIAQKIKLLKQFMEGKK